MTPRLDVEQRFRTNETGYLADDESRDSSRSDDSGFSNPRTPAEEELINRIIEPGFLNKPGARLRDHFLLRRTDFYPYPSYARKLKLEIERRLRIQKAEVTASRARDETAAEKPFSSPILDVISSIMGKLQRYEFRAV